MMMSRHILRRNNLVFTSFPPLRQVCWFSSSPSPNVVCNNVLTGSGISPVATAIGKPLFTNQIKAPPGCFTTASSRSYLTVLSRPNGDLSILPWEMLSKEDDYKEEDSIVEDSDDDSAPQKAAVDTVRMKSVTYLIEFNGFEIETVLTNRASMVEKWLSQVSSTLAPGSLIGLGSDLKTAKTLHFCVGNKCLIYHLRHMDIFPLTLPEFMTKFKFAGVGIKQDMDHFDDLRLEVKGVDLAELAKKKWPDRYDSLPGLHRLAKDLDIRNSEDDVKKPSNWKSDELTTAQIEKACIDAFLSFEIGKKLA